MCNIKLTLNFRRIDVIIKIKIILIFDQKIIFILDVNFSTRILD